MDEWSGVAATWQETTHKSKYWMVDTPDIVHNMENHSVQESEAMQ